MRKIYIVIFSLMTTCTGLAQQFVPLRVDSSYNWLWTKGIKNDTLISIYWTAYTYNAAGQLIQKRIPSSIFNYKYSQDTLFQSSSRWQGAPLGRITTVFNNGKQVARWFYYHKDGQYILANWYTHSYDEAGQDTLYLVQRLNGSTWVNQSKTVRRYDSNGNLTEEADYKADNNQQWKYHEGFEIKYDQQNRPVKQSRFTGITGNKRRSYEELRHYDSNNRLDTLWQCLYDYPEYEVCEYGFVSTFQYIGNEIVDCYTEALVNNVTTTKTLERTFTGPQVYSNKPDSILLYFVSNNGTQTLIQRQYFEYKNLDDGAVYFKSEKYSRIQGFWTLTNVQEEWYHTVDVDSLSGGGTEYIATFPNPCKAGQQIYFKKTLADDGELDILIFDVQGRLVAQHELTNQLSVPAPSIKGVYSVVIRRKDSLVGISKLVVVH